MPCIKNGQKCFHMPPTPPPIQPITPGIAEAKERRDYNDTGVTNLAITSMVFTSSEYEYPQSTFIAILERPAFGNIRKNVSFSSKPNSKTGSVVGLQI